MVELNTKGFLICDCTGVQQIWNLLQFEHGLLASIPDSTQWVPSFAELENGSLFYIAC